MLLPTVSIILPVYNGEKYLAGAIESMLGQDCPDFELIVINDGSTDESLKIIEAYRKQDDRIVVVNQPNKGIVEALNAGIRVSIGKYIARMDSDDVSHPSRIGKQVAYLDKNSDVVACGTSYRLIGDAEGTVTPPLDYESCHSLLNVTGCIAHPTVMIRADILRANKIFYESQFLFAEDYRLWSVLSQYGKLENLEEVLFDYRIHNQQITQTKVSLQRKAQAKIAAEQMGRAGISIESKIVLSAIFFASENNTNVIFYLARFFKVFFLLMCRIEGKKYHLTRYMILTMLSNLKNRKQLMSIKN